MKELDHTILIAAAPEAVWTLLGDLNQNPAWQVDCQNVVFLSKQRSGKGARWRYRSLSGKEHELEVTAWYDGLGYEYRHLDGSAHGRLRLQEIAEGTTVQWTFSYEPRGRLGGMRNVLGVSTRGYRKVMDESLQALQTTVKRSVGQNRDFAARSLMRDGVSWDARVNYRPRHPSLLREGVIQAPTTPVEEPPLQEGDTRPIPALAIDVAEAPLSRQPVESEPEPPSAPPPSMEDLDVPQPRSPRPGQMELSIWEVFGMERPQQAASVPVQSQAPPEPEPAAGVSKTQLPGDNPPAWQPGHPGWRRLQRWQSRARSASGPSGR